MQNPSGAESIELVDYDPIRARKDAADREARIQLKRNRKLEWLESQDEMKFSHSVQFNAVPDWSSHYIAYSNLKKLYVTCTTLALRHQPGSFYSSVSIYANV